MAIHVTPQADLFEPVELESGSVAAAGTGIAPLPPLAIPCGFRNCRNAPCRRLGTRPVTIDGAPLQHRGWHLIHCDSACPQGGDAKPGDRKTPANGREGGPVR